MAMSQSPIKVVSPIAFDEQAEAAASDVVNIVQPTPSHGAIVDDVARLDGALLENIEDVVGPDTIRACIVTLPRCCVAYAGLPPNVPGVTGGKTLWMGRVGALRALLTLRRLLHLLPDQYERARGWAGAREAVLRPSTRLLNTREEYSLVRDAFALLKQAALARGAAFGITKQTPSAFDVLDTFALAGARGVVVHLAGTGGFCYGALRVARTYAEAGYICVTPDLVGHANAFRARVPLPMVPIDADLAALVSARATARAAARPLRPRSTRL